MSKLEERIRGGFRSVGIKSDLEAAKALHVTPSTYSKRLKSPEKFTAKELRLMRDTIGDTVPDEITGRAPQYTPEQFATAVLQMIAKKLAEGEAE